MNKTKSIIIQEIFSIFKYRLLLLTSILTIFFILFYICAQYYKLFKKLKLNKKYIYCFKFKLIDFLYLFKKRSIRKPIDRQIEMKKYSFINKSFSHSISSNFDNYKEEEEKRPYKKHSNSIYSSSASLLTTTTNLTVVPLIMITDTTSLQTEIIEFDDEYEKMSKRIENRLRNEINEKMPPYY
jgi:hypothetical protein